MENLKKLSKINLDKKRLRGVAETAGVYIFWDKNDRAVYIGKSKNLKRRISSYLSYNLGTRTAQMMGETIQFSTVKVTSELEALLLEAELVHKNQPKYNSTLKDDKHPLYIRITNEAYPRVLTARKKDENPPIGGKNLLFLGPFPSSSNVRSVLRLLRRIFPYAQHTLGKRGCLYSQLGQCNPCPNEIEKLKNRKTKKDKKHEYLGNIKYIKSVLTGRFTFVRNSLERVMKQYSKDENFETAALTRKQIERLDYITQAVTPTEQFLKNPNLLADIRDEESEELTKILERFIKLPKKLSRIECFDVAHLVGTNPTASMVTFINGEPDKSLYRHFRIKQKKGQSDTDSMYEVGMRRTKYLSNWGIPDLIIVDGGKAQVGVFRRIFAKHKIPVIGLAKKEEKIVIPVKRFDLSTHSFIEIKVQRGPAKNLVQRLRDEAHRFARRYHHKLLQKELIPGS